MGLYDFTIYDIIKRNAMLYGKRTALIAGEKRITHRQFLETVDRVACGLLGLGIEKGDRIAVLAQNSIKYFYLYGASAKIGAIMLPINWRFKPEEVEYVISDVSPKIIFAGSEFQDLATSIVSKFGFIEGCYGMDQAEGNLPAFNDLKENDGENPEVDVHSDDAFVIMHTAAVTGKPRGATLSHGSLIAFNVQSMYYYNLTEKDCHLCILPLFHVAALGIALNVMQAGGTNVVLPKFDVDLALTHIHKDKVTIFAEFPPILQKLLDKNREKDKDYDLSSLRIVVGLDNPDTVRRFEKITGATFWTTYAQTETSGFVSYAPYFERQGSAGLPGFLVEVKIMDDAENFAETGDVGEILVRGPMVFKGYWGLENVNKDTFRGGWHHTGDMGWFDEEGYLWYIGRKAEKELIKPGGENVYPAEVEKVIMENPSVEDVTVIGVPDEQWGEGIKAVCVLKKDKILTESQLIEFVASKIARFKKPKYVVFVSSLPKSEDGSINREKVKAEHGAPIPTEKQKNHIKA
jgi:acyl-CoA synthetase (AMP-forming)/AMP-acid ligase II